MKSSCFFAIDTWTADFFLGHAFWREKKKMCGKLNDRAHLVHIPSSTRRQNVAETRGQVSSNDTYEQDLDDRHRRHQK